MEIANICSVCKEFGLIDLRLRELGKIICLTCAKCLFLLEVKK